MTVSLTRRRWALFALFFVPGLSLASWVTRTPAIRDLLHASTAQMGLVLFGLSVGSMLGILCSGALVAKFGGRPVIAAGIAGVALSMPVIGLGAGAGAAWVVAAGLFVFGLGLGAADVAMNVEGADVERAGRRPFLPALHGCFSLGTVVGALAGIGATATGFPVVWHLVLTGALGAGVFGAAIRSVLPGTGRVPLLRADGSAGTAATPPIWKDARLVLIGVIVLAMALTEGTANDWLPLIMVDGHGFGEAWGSAIFAVFAASMTLGRFAGGPVIARLGRALVLGISAGFALLGLVVVAFVDSQFTAVAAVVLWGLGASLGFPVALSAAGDSGPNPAVRVSLVATIGYIAFLVGPPLLGFVGEQVGLRHALVIPMIVVLVAMFLSPAVKNRPVVERQGLADEPVAPTRL
ncbi:MFS transporter [Pseudactinotalea sp. Z1739]|uniref:MFS transporter n=1 Tax=Pseudactinotalea sp. Z1739 TaxID=3413028 RepID=UPI003C7E3097